jgi:transketolase
MASASQDRVLREAAKAPLSPLANALRALAIDAVQAANSGHPGAPMGMAEMATALWTRHLKHDPANPQWFDRDRFVLSNGHASMLLYALLHLSGYDLPLDELKRFRQLHSKTPGHPEVGITPGVETTTGPLGQGLTNAVGMALAEKLLADEFNQAEHSIVDHHTYVFLGDGCLMEGISHEACSLAGTLHLSKLIALYDDNGISIDGAVQHWFADDTAMRFRSYGWNVIGPIDGHYLEAVSEAITSAKSQNDKPSIILCRTAIGRGSPNREGTAKSHGEPLGAAEIAATRERLNWNHDAFEVPDSIRSEWNAIEKGGLASRQWRERFESYRSAYPDLASEFERRMSGQLPSTWQESSAALLAQVAASQDNIATRKSSQLVLQQIAPVLKELLGGSADLTGSNLTDFPGCGAVRGGQTGGRHINYGVREFGMAAIMNGMALHGGYIPYGGTFLTFSDYSRNAIRMAARMAPRTNPSNTRPVCA